jgi:hypothetical protein
MLPEVYNLTNWDVVEKVPCLGGGDQCLETMEIPNIFGEILSRLM